MTKKPTLSEIQHAFENAILYGNEDINDWIITDGRGDATKRMAIYQYAYRARLIDVLFIDYPTIHQILGDELFSDACHAYLKAYPSESYSVRWFGQHFSAFLSKTLPYSKHEYLSEMASFEWQKGECFDGKNMTALTLSELAKVPQNAFISLTFTFVPTFRIMTCHYDTPMIWKTINEDADLPMPTALPYPIDWAMWRRNFAPTWQSLDVDHAWAIRSALDGANFLELCDGLREWIDDEHIPNRVAGFIQTWLNEGMLRELKI